MSHTLQPHGLPGSSVHGILQVRRLEWVAISFSKRSYQPRDWAQASYIVGEFLTTEPLGKPLLHVKSSVQILGVQVDTTENTKNKKQEQLLLIIVLVAQSFPALWSYDYSLPVSSVHGILQARILEWIAIPFSRWSSWSRNQIQVSCVAGRFFTIWATVLIYWLFANWKFPIQRSWHYFSFISTTEGMKYKLWWCYGLTSVLTQVMCWS